MPGEPVLVEGVLTAPGYYRQVGKTVDFFMELTMASDTTYGSGFWQVALPVAARNVSAGRSTTARSATPP